MKHRPRAWRITMWTTLAATVLLAGGAIGSWGWYGYWADAQGRIVGLSDGALVCGHIEKLRGCGWSSGPSSEGALLWRHIDCSSPGATGWLLFIGLWTPACAAAALATFSALKVCRRRPGLCPCGYILSGLPKDAPCPECGPPSHA